MNRLILLAAIAYPTSTIADAVGVPTAFAETCKTVTVDRTLTLTSSITNAETTVVKYGSTSCANAAVIDLKGLQGKPIGWRHAYAGPTPTTKVACEAIYLEASAGQISAGRLRGAWNGTTCTLPVAFQPGPIRTDDHRWFLRAYTLGTDGKTRTYQPVFARVFQSNVPG